MASVLIVVFVASNLFIISASGLSYGKFEMMLHSVNACKGPRQRDCVNLTYTLLPGNKLLNIQGQILENSSIDVIRIRANRNDNSDKLHPIVDLKFEKPCQQQRLFKVLFTDFIDPSNCSTVKAVMNYTLDAPRIARTLWADSFFYGNFTIRTSVYGRRCNLGCTDIHVTYVPAA